MIQPPPSSSSRQRTATDPARRPALRSASGIAWAALVIVLLTLVHALSAQDPVEPLTTPPAGTPPGDDGAAGSELASTAPAGTARLMIDDRAAANVGFLLRGDGPRFSLAPIAQAFGVEVRVGPLSASHALQFADREVIVGPDSPSFVETDGEGRSSVRPISSSPIPEAGDLKVPLDFLEATFGESSGSSITWDPVTLRLHFDRRSRRELAASATLVHQYRVSTLEISLEDVPRFRFVERENSASLEITDARLLWSGDSPDTTGDPLVQRVDLEPTEIRLLLAPDAAATAPRLIRGDPAAGLPARWVVDVYRRRRAETPQTAGTLPGERDRPTRSAGVRTIVLDPGHGGSETGAVSPGGMVEAELTLQVARMLRTRLTQRLPVRVLLTREDDVDIPHAARVAFANQNKADLFISIHFNSYFDSSAHGAETYFLSREASDRLAAAAAERENAAAGERLDQGLDLILWDLAQSLHLADSQRFATLVQEELNGALGLRDRGVRQAPFLVLMGADMPAVLVELGFLSNPEEERQLRSAAHLSALTDALVRAITRFRTQVEARRSGTSTAPNGSTTGEAGSSGPPAPAAPPPAADDGAGP
ncbi:MAG: N-acetylmuramoyl-L-alanine amidase [Acidobacteriota bacterium]